MCYRIEHEQAHLCPSLTHHRPACPSEGFTVVRCVCDAPQPDSVSQRPWPARPCHRRDLGLRRSDRAQRHPGVPCPGARGRATPLVCATSDPTRGLYAGPTPAMACPAPSKPAHLRQTHPCVDSRPGGRRGVRGGDDPTACQWRNHSPGPVHAPDAVETGQTLDHQSRPGIRQEKTPRDRLMRLAATHPEWVLGFGDEVWWSRLAQPPRHTWTPSEREWRLVEQSLPQADAKPKALVVRFTHNCRVSGSKDQATCLECAGAVGVWLCAARLASRRSRTWRRFSRVNVHWKGRGRRLHRSS